MERERDNGRRERGREGGRVIERGLVHECWCKQALFTDFNHSDTLGGKGATLRLRPIPERERDGER